MAWIPSSAVRQRVRGLNKEKISARTLDRWVERGLLPPPTYFGKRRYWSSEQLDAYDATRLAAARQTEPAS
jgi:DNA-binding transcriptional MerR regulator